MIFYKFQWLLIIALIVALFFSSNAYLEKQIDSWMQEQLKEDLLSDAHTIAAVLKTFKPDLEPHSLDPLIKKIRNKRDNHRITIINNNGIVLSDSKKTLSQILKMENHKDRPEFINSTQESHGVSIRYSETLQREMLYIAIPFTTDSTAETSGHIRIAVALDSTQQYTKKLHLMQKIVALIGSSILAIILFISYKMLSKSNELQKKQLRKQVKAKTKDLLNIQKFSQVLASCDNTDELAGLVTSTACLLFPGTKGALSITHPSLDTNEIISSWGDDWNEKAHFHPNDCWALRRGSVYLSSEDGVEPKCKHFSDDYSNTICVPLIAQSVAIGALHIVLETKPSDDLKNRFITTAEHIGLALANINLRESLKRQAIRDPLTNLYNRRFLDETLKHELLRAERSNQCVGLMMIDVDHFKKFNDSFGHDAGDYALQIVAKTFTNVIRGEDICCRYGGEEFIIVMPNTSADILQRRAQTILKTMAETDLLFNNKSLGRITLSIGLALYPTLGKSQQEIINAADDALYKAKANGRNQVILA